MADYREDVAWVDVLPSMDRWLPELNRGIGTVMPSAGRTAGAAFGTSFGTAAASSVQTASQRMSTALRGVQDATGKVHVAEAQLQQVRSSARATDAQTIAAQEKLASARRSETAANEKLHAATTNLTRAQQTHTSTVTSSSRATEEHTTKVRGLHTGMLNLSSAVNIAFGAFYAFRTVGNFLGGTIKAASDLNEEVNKSKVVFGDSAQTVLAWSKTTAAALGISQQQALASAGTFGNLFRAMGLAPKASSDMSMGLVQLASDLASFNNANPADVLEAMRAGLVGEMEPMRRYGVDLSDVRLRQEAMNQGIYDGKGILNSSQKAQAAYALMLQQTGLAQGDFARTSDGLANQQRILSAEWTNAKATLGTTLMPALIDVTKWLTGSAIPALVATGNWVKDNISWLAPLAVAIAGIVVVIKAWQIAQALLNAVMYANPIYLVIGAIVAIGAALYTAWNTSETFRNVVKAVFAAIVAAGQWMWAALQTVWDALVTAWHAVAGAAQWLWSNILQPVFSAIATAWSAMVTGITWAWDNVLHPIWNVIAAIATAIFRVVVVVIFGEIKLAWFVMSTYIEFVWNSILHPLWNAVAAVATWLWQNILKPVFEAIGAAWNGLITGIQWAWENILKPVWNAISTAAGWLWNTILAPIFGAIGAGFHALGTGLEWVYENIIKRLMIDPFVAAINFLKDQFGAIVQGIKVLWDGLKAVVAAPINFVIRTVLRDGLFKAWNWVVDHLGLPGGWKIDLNSSWLQGISLAGGGPVPGYSPTPTSDNIRANLTANEYVQPVASHAFYGTRAMNAVRDRTATIAMAGGGVVPGAQTWGSLWSTVRGHFPGAVLTSAYRAGANDWHGRGDAIDVSFAGNPQSLLMPLAAWIASSFPNSTELIHNPNGSIKNGRQVPGSFWGSEWPAHVNHVHWAMTPEAIAGGGGGGVNVFGSVIEVYNKIKDGISRVVEMASSFGSSPFVQMAASLPGKLLGGMWDMAKDLIATYFVGPSNEPNPVGQAGGVGIKDVIRSIFSSNFGWGDAANWGATDYVVGHESGWNPRAKNPNSTASGLFQMIDSTWRAFRNILGQPFGRAMDAPVAAQGWAGGHYIKDVYGSPVGAQRYWSTHGYYDDGGILRPLNGTGVDERVLSPQQTSDFHRLVSSLTGGGDGAGMPIWHFYLGDREITDLIDARVEYREDVRALDLRSAR